MDTQKRIERIKWLIDNGVPVYDENIGYRCIKDNIGQYLVVFTGNDYCIGLFGYNDTTLNATNPFFFNENGEKINL